MACVAVAFAACARAPSRAADENANAKPGLAPAPAPVWHLGEPVIDSHVHIYPNMVALARSLEVFKGAGIGRFAIKSAGAIGTAKYQASLAMREVLDGRMRVFANINWKGIDDPRFPETQVRLLEQGAADGIAGIKIFKALGLGVRLADGSLLKVDDPRLSPIFEACGRLGLILAWHVGDPVAFFAPVTPQNERYAELKIADSWSFHGKDYPSHDELLAARDRVIEQHPKTIFLLIHLANYPEDLGYVDRLLTKYPNVYVDISARVPEFGRHSPEAVRALFTKHQDRILFGSDFIAGARGGMQLGSVWHVDGEEPGVSDGVEYFRRHWQYFETDDRQVAHPTPIQGAWKVDGVKLPAELLRKLYITNAERLLWSGSPPRPFKSPANSTGLPTNKGKP